MNVNGLVTRVGLVFIFAFVIVCCWLSPLDVNASSAFQTVPPPPNDNFEGAAVIGPLPFTAYSDNTAATLETGEPVPQCADWANLSRTVWYVYRPIGTGLVSTRASTSFYPAAGIYYGDSLASLQEIRCVNSWWDWSPVYFLAQEGLTYYIQIGSQSDYGGPLTFYAEPAPPVSVGFWFNPWSPDTLDTISFYGSTEDPAGQPFVSYDWDFGDGATSSGRETQHRYASAGTYTIVFTATTEDGRSGSATQIISVTPPPPLVVQYFYSPLQPSTYDMIQFQSTAYDPKGQPLIAPTWNFGDGTGGDGFYPQHRYPSEGVYTAAFKVETADGRTGSTSQVINVENHDVAITKVSVPNTARTLQTKQVSVGVNSRYHDELVRVELCKSVYGTYDGFECLGSYSQLVRAQTLNKNTAFVFNYTFTAADALIGKVTFKAVASIEPMRDLQGADNTYISLPVKVSGGKLSGASVEEEGVLLFLPEIAGD